MFMRHRMNVIIHLLETQGFKKAKRQILSPKNKLALLSLADTGCVKLERNSALDIKRVILLDHYATYKLERQDVWTNRVMGFVLGVATSVAAALISGILPI